LGRIVIISKQANRLLLPGDMFVALQRGVNRYAKQRKDNPIITTGSSLKDKGTKLIEAANSTGGKDNVTVVLVQNNKVQHNSESVPGPGWSAPRRRPRRARRIPRLRSDDPGALGRRAGMLHRRSGAALGADRTDAGRDPLGRAGLHLRVLEQPVRHCRAAARAARRLVVGARLPTSWRASSMSGPHVPRDEHPGRLAARALPPRHRQAAAADARRAHPTVDRHAVDRLYPARGHRVRRAGDEQQLPAPRHAT